MRPGEIFRTSVKRGLRTLGHELNWSDYAHKYAFGCHLAKVFKENEIDYVLDVGAHVGGYHDFLRLEVGYRGPIVSFEPVRAQVDQLTKRAERDPHWHIRDCALGEEDGIREIKVMANSVFTSFLEPDHSLVDHLTTFNRVERHEVVRIRRLDTVFDALPEVERAGNVFLKLDTQGYDLRVLAGAEETLPRVRGLQAEVSFRKIYREMPSFEEAYPFLTDLGYDVTGMYPVSRDHAQRVVEFDCVMIRGDDPSPRPRR